MICKLFQKLQWYISKYNTHNIFVGKPIRQFQFLYRTKEVCTMSKNKKNDNKQQNENKKNDNKEKQINL